MRDSISIHMSYIQKIILLVGDGHRTKAILLNYSLVSFTLVALTTATLDMGPYLYNKYNKEGLAASFKSLKSFLKVIYYYIKYLSFVIFLSPFIYVSAPKVLANQTAAVFELLSGGRDIDKMGEKFKNELHEDISVKSLEESIREMLDDRKKEAEA
jgi:hypothetical protein